MSRQIFPVGRRSHYGDHLPLRGFLRLDAEERERTKVMPTRSIEPAGSFNQPKVAGCHKLLAQGFRELSRANQPGNHILNE
jgi:hypothetical protein